MNGTCWTTLSQFVQSLGNSGVCEIEESERVWSHVRFNHRVGILH